MISGIYKITFTDGSIYVGKSIDIERRWNEHINKFNKGTASKELQHRFNLYGMPEFHILHECHPDHIDLLESIYIDMYWEELLNTTRSNLVPDEDKVFLLSRVDNLAFSTATHLRCLEEQTERIEQLTNKMEKILDRDTFIKTLKSENENLKQEIYKLKNRTIFERLFNM